MEKRFEKIFKQGLKDLFNELSSGDQVDISDLRYYGNDHGWWRETIECRMHDVDYKGFKNLLSKEEDELFTENGEQQINENAKEMVRMAHSKIREYHQAIRVAKKAFLA